MQIIFGIFDEIISKELRRRPFGTSGVKSAVFQEMEKTFLND